jgi:uncharacterized protein (DUF427 family)
MGLRLGQHLMSLTDRLRYEPVARRVRATYAGNAVLDTADAVLVWEPRRVVPMYAAPEDDIRAALTPCETPTPPPDLPSVLGPVNFGWHLHAGESFTVEVAGRSFEAAAFRPADPDLGGRVIVDCMPFEWVEEDQTVLGHPHDPFKRIDVLSSSRHVQVALEGEVLADSRRAVAVYETHIPVRWYFPRDDVRMERLTSSSSTSVCAYKGNASYFSVVGTEAGEDVAWTYVDPLLDAHPVKDHVCFYSERTDLTVDGADQPRPVTPWSSPKDQERI